MNRLSQRVAAIGINFGSIQDLRAEIEAIATDQGTTFYLNSANELTSRVTDVARAICPGLYLAQTEGHSNENFSKYLKDQRTILHSL